MLKQKSIKSIELLEKSLVKTGAYFQTKSDHGFKKYLENVIKIHKIIIFLGFSYKQDKTWLEVMEGK